MDHETFREQALSLHAVTEDTPFGPEVLIFKVGGKMFASLSLDSAEARANLKCDPERIPELREEYPAILPGYHMNKKHWNTLLLAELSDELVNALLEHSYMLVRNSLTAKLRKELDGLE